MKGTQLDRNVPGMLNVNAVCANNITKLKYISQYMQNLTEINVYSPFADKLCCFSFGINHSWNVLAFALGKQGLAQCSFQQLGNSVPGTLMPIEHFLHLVQTVPGMLLLSVHCTN